MAKSVEVVLFGLTPVRDRVAGIAPNDRHGNSQRRGADNAQAAKR